MASLLSLTQTLCHILILCACLSAGHLHAQPNVAQSSSGQEEADDEITKENAADTEADLLQK